MLENERLEQILEMLKTQHTLSVRYLSKVLYVSEPTVRRDIKKLADEKLVRRVHGGITADFTMKSELLSYRLRETEMPEAKAFIAQMAARMVKQNDVIFLDSTTTSAAIARNLPNDLELKVITTGIRPAEILSERSIFTMLAGGILAENADDLTGYYTEMMLKDIHADIAFLSARGLSLDGRICTANIKGVPNFRLMMKNTKKAVLCLTSNKIGRDYFMTHEVIENVDEVLCDKPLPEELQNRVGANRKQPAGDPYGAPQSNG